MEIERKFLLSQLPDLSGCTCHQITQAYISTDPVIRIRQMDSQFFLTIKSHGHLAREEFELPLTRAQYDHLVLKSETEPLIKKRYILPLDGGLFAELDIYSGKLEGLYTVEVEFPSIQDAESFTPPHWFGKDVTEDKRYKNNHLSRYGLPE